MTDKPADGRPMGRPETHTAETASGGTIPRPPSKAELDRISEAQTMITDEWAPETAPGQAGTRKPAS